MTSPLPPVLLVGAGRMGGALLAGWRKAGLVSAVVVEPSMTTSAGEAIHVVNDIDNIHVNFVPAIVIFAVKPQAAASVLPAYERFAGTATFLSIMAGQTIAGMAAKIGAQAKIVRAMPNTPAAIGRGVSVACAGPGVTEEARAVCDRLLAAAGAVAWVDDEAMLDAVTAVSGSGPAYVFLLAELMEQAALDEGLPPDLARLLARETVAGSGALLAASKEDASKLREGVTSPAGTTAAAMEVLMAANAWPASMRRAIGAATERSRALAQ